MPGPGTTRSPAAPATTPCWEADGADTLGLIVNQGGRPEGQRITREDGNDLFDGGPGDDTLNAGPGATVLNFGSGTRSGPRRQRRAQWWGRLPRRPGPRHPHLLELHPGGPGHARRLPTTASPGEGDNVRPDNEFIEGGVGVPTPS